MASPVIPPAALASEMADSRDTAEVREASGTDGPVAAVVITTGLTARGVKMGSETKGLMAPIPTRHTRTRITIRPIIRPSKLMSRLFSISSM